MLTFVVYLALGVLSDILIGKYYLALSAHRALLASGLAIAIPLTTFLVMAQALETKNITCILGFVLGNGLGTYWVVKHDKSV